MSPKGSFPVRVAKSDGSFPSRFDVFTDAHHSSFGTKPAKNNNLSLSKSIRIVNSCLKDSGRAVYPMYGGYKSLSPTEQENDALPLLEHVESRCEETLDFGVATH